MRPGSWWPHNCSTCMCTALKYLLAARYTMLSAVIQGMGLCSSSSVHTVSEIRKVPRLPCRGDSCAA